jgi:PTH2 family peptidyl-tRNA hydrolase
MEFTHKLVIVIRADLDLSCGKACAQAGHAAVECALKARREKPRWFRRWYAEGQKKVVLRANSLDEIMDLKQLAESREIPCALIVDAGLTEVPPGTPTCLGIGPGPNPEIDRITGNLPLY